MNQRIWLAAITVLTLIGCSRQPSAQNPVPSAQPQAQVQTQAPAAPQADPQPAPAQVAQIVIPSGTAIRVRLDEQLDTKRNRPGDRFSATLAAPIQENNLVIVPQGTRFSGHVTTAQASGRMKGRAMLGLTLDSFAVNGREYPVVTTSAGRASARHKKRNLALIGGGTGVGALIGGIAGGGKGALIGAGAGAGAGVIGAAFTGKKQVTLPAETMLTFRLEEAVEL